MPAIITPGTSDWTLAQPSGDLSPHLIFARSVDWSQPPLGDMSSWSPEFRQVANLLMANSHPAALFWGEELTVMYNKAYADGVAGEKHPELMGTGFKGPFAEMWDIVEAQFIECRETGRSISMVDQMLPIRRQSFLEESYFTWSLTPLYGGTPHLLGLYNAPFETTRQTIVDGRTKTLLKLGEELGLAKSVASFWRQILKGLEHNEFDFPFALLYSVGDDLEVEEENASMSSESSQSMKFCILEGTLGVPEGHIAAQTRMDLKRSRGGFIPTFREAMQTREPKRLSLKDSGSLELVQGLEWRGFGEPSTEAVVLPIRPTNAETVLGFLLVGVNPRRPYDTDYESFIMLLNRQLATALASVTLFEEEIRRGNNAAKMAALERHRLSEELAVQRSRLQRIAEISPVGYEMTGHHKNMAYEMSFMDTIAENSVPKIEEGWRRLVVDGLPWSAELGLKKSWYDSKTSEQFENWILAACQPEFSVDGVLKSIMVSMTDITLQKGVEQLQNRRLQEAEETRRQQTNFIESADTIQLCAQFQRFIVDDILTISRLDSNLLLIIPVAIRPVEVIRQALKIFVAECLSLDIKMNFRIKEAFKKLKVDRVMMDSSRLLQVLVNLLTNAIKFTKKEDKREIDISINAYIESPRDGDFSFEYFPTKKSLEKKADLVAGEDWGKGEVLYLRIEVRDTGCGLTPDEKINLFTRFSQASPRTHVQYGGSGLGLFISRQLVELQGGEIGVGSAAGKGSTFAFFVQTRRAETKEDTKEMETQLSQDIQMNARLATTAPKSMQEFEGSVSHMLKHIILTATALSSKTTTSDWHVLIVEDNLVNQRVLASQMRKLSCTVHVANHGGEALELLRETKYYKGRQIDGKDLSIILMDLEMPVMDGLTCVKRIRQMEAEGSFVSRVPIIAVTANARGEQISAAKNSGMDGIFNSPVFSECVTFLLKFNVYGCDE